MESEEIQVEEESKVTTDAEELKPKPPTKFAPRGIETELSSKESSTQLVKSCCTG